MRLTNRVLESRYVAAVDVVIEPLTPPPRPCCCCCRSCLLPHAASSSLAKHQRLPSHHSCTQVIWDVSQSKPVWATQSVTDALATALLLSCWDAQVVSEQGGVICVTVQPSECSGVRHMKTPLIPQLACNTKSVTQNYCCTCSSTPQ